MNQDLRTRTADIRPREILAVLRRRWVLIVLTLVIAIAAGYLYTQTVERVYRSVTELAVDGKTPQFNQANPFDPLNEVTVPNPIDDIPTQLEILKSYNVLAASLTKLGIQPPPPSPELRVDPDVQVRQFAQTSVVELSVDSKNPDICAKLAAELPNQYALYTQNNLQGQLLGAIKFVKGRVQESSDQLKEAQKQLSAFRTKYRISNFDQENLERVQRVGQANAELRLADSHLASSKNYLDSMIAARQGLPASIDSPGNQANSGEVQRQKEKIADITSQLEAKRVLYQEGSREVQALKAQLNEQTSYLAAMPNAVNSSRKERNPLILQYDEKIADARANYAGATAARTDAATQVHLAEKDLDELVAHTGEYNRLNLEVTTLGGNYETLNKQMQSFELRQSAAKVPMTPISQPTLPEIVKPRLPLNLAVAFLLGLLVAGALVVVREAYDDRIYSADSAKQAASIKSLGAVPLGTSNKPALITNGSANAESYRLLRSNLLFTVGGEALRSIAVVSATNNEGRTEIAANLASSLALGSHQVVVIDGNLRNGSLDKMFNVAEGPGVAEVLSGAKKVSEVLQRSAIEGLFVITAGDFSKAPAELFSSEAFPALLEELKERFHFMIVDTSACLASADAQMVAASCDASVYVLKIGVSRRSAVRYCIEMLSRTKTHVLGVIYNRQNVNPRTQHLDVEEYDESA